MRRLFADLDSLNKLKLKFPPEVLDIDTDSSILDNKVGSGIYSGKLDLKITLLQ